MFYHEFIFTWKYRQGENLVPVSLQKKMYTCAFFPMDSSRVNSPCSSPRLPFTWLATRGIRESLSYNTPICNLSVPDTVFHIRSSCHVTLNRGPSPLTFRFLGRGKVPSVNMKFPKSAIWPSSPKQWKFLEKNTFGACRPTVFATARQISGDTCLANVM